MHQGPTPHRPHSEPPAIHPTVERTIEVRGKYGLHARPALALSEVAQTFDGEVSVRKGDDGEMVDGKSIMSLMLLAAAQGSKLKITAHGGLVPDDFFERIDRAVNHGEE